MSGWHWAHPTVVGKQLVKEMITRDENHPSIIFWSNGNEGGCLLYTSIADEKGKYKYEFTLPQEWEGKQIELVFEAVMTDAKVTINCLLYTSRHESKIRSGTWFYNKEVPLHPKVRCLYWLE